MIITKAPTSTEYQQIRSELKAAFSVNVSKLKEGGFQVAKGKGQIFSEEEHKAIYELLTERGFRCQQLAHSLKRHGAEIVHSAGHTYCGVRWLKLSN